MNILWIMTDQHHAACLGCMGNPVIQTPHLDRLAREGVVFENAYCQSPVSMASRGSLMTGRYPSAVGIRGMGILPPSETTFAEWVQRQGYHTGAFGKVHLTPEQYTRHELGSDIPILDWRRFAADAQLDESIADEPAKRDYGFKEHIGCDDACQGRFRSWLGRRAPELLDRGKEPIPGCPGDTWVSPYPSEHHQTTFIAASTTDFIRARSEHAQPWHAFCSFVGPHHPFEAPADQIARYDLADMPLPPADVTVDMTDPPAPLIPAIDEFRGNSEEAQRRIIQHYYASISLIDDGVGLLLKTLEESGQQEDTLIVFVADHGEHLGNHGLIRKPSIHYDDIIRVPLLMRMPGLPGGRRVDGLVELVDVYPTLLGLLDMPANPGIQGSDWSRHLRQGEAIGREDIYVDMFDLDPMTHATAKGPYCACQTVRTRDWKLSVYPTAHPACSQLFDLANDPRESRNRFHDADCREIGDAMLWRLLKRIHDNTDPLPLRLTQW